MKDAWVGKTAAIRNMEEKMDGIASPLPTVAIVIPVCNEECSMEELKAKLLQLQLKLAPEYAVQYVFVDDGSTDRTSDLLGLITPGGGTSFVLKHRVNRGVGAAFRTAFTHVSADVVCTMDADCSYTPEHLFEMIEMVANGVADVVVASPYHPMGGVDGVPLWRLLLSAQCSALYRFLSPLKLYTYTSIFRAYRGTVVRQLLFSSDGFTATVEILLVAQRMGYTVSELPLVLHRRMAGMSKMRILQTTRAHLGLMQTCLLLRLKQCGHSRSDKTRAVPEAPEAGMRSDAARQGTQL